MANDQQTQQPDREARIRECAYHLWESDGKPYGRDVEFWQRARHLVAHEDNDAPASPEPDAAEPNAAKPPAATTAAPAQRRRKAPAGRRQTKAS
ncbi:MAG TPA: DUF2934 domain-containing protein [Acetobacteraceae bacterium]|jgi:hypothetical protein